jgi:fimbrial chaperone protein
MNRIKIKNNRRQSESWKLAALGLLITLFLTSHTAAASNFNITPINIFLDPQTKIEKLTVTNNGEDDLTVQLKAFRWTQDEKGQELYEDTKDIILSPKIATLKKDEEKIIRVGTHLKSDLSEKTYRIFVEEIPNADREELKGTTIQMYLKIGVPLFLSPIKKDQKGAIETITLQKGKAAIKIKNKGNQHLIVNNIQVRGLNPQGQEIFSQDLSGWYILSGVSKIFETTLPENICQDIGSLKVEVKTNNKNINFQAQLPVEKTMCGQSI